MSVLLAKDTKNHYSQKRFFKRLFLLLLRMLISLSLSPFSQTYFQDLVPKSRMTVETQSLEDALKHKITLGLNFLTLYSILVEEAVFGDTVSAEVLQGTIFCWCKSLY